MNNGKHPSWKAAPLVPLLAWFLLAEAAHGEASPARDWWSLRPLARPPVPALTPAEARRARTPIDAFIIARQRERGLTLSPPADRRTLIRRVHFDLLGLPPAPAEIEDFVGDRRSDAYGRLVDRLLASPHLGERWARHWLDIVHYGDTHGYDKDKLRPHAWPYRDYVIRAFNDDRPHGRFVREQIAGDVIYPGTADGIVATGFLAAGPWDFIGHAEVPESKVDGKIARHLDRDDMVRATMETFVSTTVGCARCHEHKFDPVTMEDYYSLQAVFAALDRADRPYETDPGVARTRTRLLERRERLAAREKRLRERIRARAGGELVELERRLEELEKKEEKAAGLAGVRARRKALLERAAGEELGAALEEISRGLREVEGKLGKLPPRGLVYAGTVHHGRGSFRGTGHTGGRPREIRVLQRGQVTAPGKLVGPGTVAVIDGVPARFDLPRGHAEGERRRALAEWIVHPRNPLTWRSMANRIWQYHFGHALAGTPGDFGRMGERPSHPELLDWLAVELRDGGQSIKKLHRLVLTSAVYRQSSRSGDADFAGIDRENRYLWRMNRRRLEAEAVRDSVLAVSGKLDRRMYGPGYRTFVLEKPEHSPHYEYHRHDPDDPATHRRSIYRFIVRSQPDPFMETLDCADPSLLVDRRNETLTALQALALLNDRFMTTLAGHFAARLDRSGGGLREKIDRAWLLAIGRSPATGELEDLLRYARRFGLPDTCRVILNLNEFLFVD